MMFEGQRGQGRTSDKMDSSEVKIGLLRLNQQSHYCVYTSANFSRPCWIRVSPEISTCHFSHVQSVFYLCTIHLLVKLRFSRLGRDHFAYMYRIKKCMTRFETFCRSLC